MSIVKTKKEANFMTKHIIEAIEQTEHRRISYAQYMNLALYAPQYGYYMREKEKIGRLGDFITSSNISDVFGQLFAKVFIRLVQTGKVAPFVSEIGGGSGRFARAVLNEWQKCSPETFSRLTYVIIEMSPYHRKKQKETLMNTLANIIQYEKIEQFQREFPNFCGIVFSNELFDAFPVHVIEKENGKLHEVFVSLCDGKLVEIKFPLENEEIVSYLKERQIVLKNGQRFEVPLMMKKFILEIGTLLKEGIMFTVDYGYTDDEWQLPIHREGSLRGYYQHQLITDPLAFPGDMDLTTHIQWDALKMYGEEAGWEFVRLMRQDHFLLAAGILEYLTEHHDSNPFSEQSKQNRAIRSLIMDGGMSSAFQVMIQQKNIDIKWREIFTSSYPI
jgi:SAM-dependent MidA family methyltransferase